MTSAEDRPMAAVEGRRDCCVIELGKSVHVAGQCA
jgi:hypothetical protein